MKKISFVILTWNSEIYIKDCIESILQIKKFETQIIVVDNGSKDKSVEILKKYEKNNQNVKVIYLDKNYGTTISRNKGLSLVKESDYICILDSDTIVNENAFEYMTDYLDKNDNVGIVGPTMYNKYNEPQISYRKFPTWKLKLYKASPIKKLNKKGEELEHYKLEENQNELNCDYLISACWLIKYDVYKKLGSLDEKIFYSPEDVEYCMRARKEGYEVVYLKKPEITHYYQRISKKKFISKANYTHLMCLGYVLRKYRKFLKEYRKIGEK